MKRLVSLFATVLLLASVVLPLLGCGTSKSEEDASTAASAARPRDGSAPVKSGAVGGGNSGAKSAGAADAK